MTEATAPNADSLSRWRGLCRLRSTLEAYALALCRESGQVEGLTRELGAQLQVMQRFAAKGDYLSFHRADHDFHELLVKAANLEALTQCWRHTAAQLDGWVLGIKREYWPNLTALHREHVRLLEVWTGADDKVAEDACHQHLEAGWQRMAAARRDPTFDTDPVERAVSFMCTHYAESIQVSWVARHISHTSTSNLHRLFRTKLGSSPHAYLRQIRMERAAQLLRTTTDSVATIASRVGYRNASHFTRDFRQHYGRTPNAVRATPEKEPESGD